MGVVVVVCGGGGGWGAGSLVVREFLWYLYTRSIAFCGMLCKLALKTKVRRDHPVPALGPLDPAVRLGTIPTSENSANDTMLRVEGDIAVHLVQWERSWCVGQ